MINLIFKILKKLKRIFYINNEIIVLKRIQTSQQSNHQNDINIRLLNYNDLNLIRARRKAVLYKEMEMGSLVYGIITDNNIAHYSCISLNNHKIGEANGIFRLPENSIYIFNCYTEENFRGRQLYYGMLVFLINQYYNKNKYIVVDKNNKISRRVIEKVGFKEIGRIKYRRIFAMRYWNINNGSEDLRSHIQKFKV